MTTAVCRDILRVLETTRIEAAERERLRAEWQAELERLEAMTERENRPMGP